MSAAQESPARGIGTDVAVLRTLEPDRAFERMYRKHASDVYRYALAVVRHAGDAEDVTQTTFLNAFRAMQRGERPVKAKSWLLAIAHNVCLQRFRNAARRPQQVPLDEDLAEALVPEESPSADDLVRALQQLSFNQRSALVMRELEGRSYAEIGEILGLPVSAVETLLFRARRALREQLETSITCSEAEELLSRQLDGRLPRGERGALRAHLRACEECARLARSQRAQRGAWKSLSIIPLPGSLASLFGGSGATVATGVAAKVAAVGLAAALVGGTYESVQVVTAKSKRPSTPAAAAPTQTVAPTTAAPTDTLSPDRIFAPVPTPTRHAAKASGKQAQYDAKGQEKKAARAGPKNNKATLSRGATGPGSKGRASAPGQAAKTGGRHTVRHAAPAKVGADKAGTTTQGTKKKATKKKVTTGSTGGSNGSGSGQSSTNGNGQKKGQTETTPSLTVSEPSSTAPGQTRKR
jgi:RNA polymerase sigma factor (sigma-70 family)